ncbi:uncharacterized protein LOC127808792 [Diospyros lotus]|uniref:uncharacterized protein LOC127808792 n=1 Tax=Diospyros lotus TaxID=55363 RepID=UPI00224F9C17|nr:uncharacterized protein LOC127808792 [Diospyros lotus]
MDDSVLALSRIADSSMKIANAIEMQATLDTINHFNWPMIMQKLESMDLDVDDVVKMMEIFQVEESLARVFNLMIDVRYMRALVFKKLGHDLPSHDHPPPA